MKIEFKNRTITYQKRGSGPNLLLIHAFPLDSRQWELQVADLKEQFSIVTMDIPGFGESEAYPEHETSVALYAEVVEHVLEAASPNESWILGGCSLGGYVVFELVRRNKIRRRGLVLSNTRAVLDTPQQAGGRQQLIERVRTEGTHVLVEAQLPRMFTQYCPPAVRARTEAIMREASKAGVLGALNALLNRPDSVPTLSMIHEPVLLIAGEHDPVSPPEEMRTIAKQVAISTFVCIDGTSHFSNLERPDSWTAHVDRWARSLGACGESAIVRCEANFSRNQGESRET